MDRFVLTKDPDKWSAWDKFNIFDKYETVDKPKISIATDGHNAKLVGSVEVDPTAWLSRHSAPEVRLMADGLVQIATRLGVDLRAELLARVKHKEALPPDKKKTCRVLNAEELWDTIKRKTRAPRAKWTELVFGGVNEEAMRHAQE